VVPQTGEPLTPLNCAISAVCSLSNIAMVGVRRQGCTIVLRAHRVHIGRVLQVYPTRVKLGQSSPCRECSICQVYFEGCRRALRAHTPQNRL
jgi:hypothetical protein